MRQNLIRVLLAILVVIPALGVANDDKDRSGPSAVKRPNILILMAEDMSARVGAFGDPVAQTPNLDMLSETGVRFPNTFTTAGVCAPSRAAHITGMHQVSIGAQHMRTRSFQPTPYRAVPPIDVKAYPELLRQAGYYTFTNHKLDYQFSDYGAGSGPFTIWDHEGDASGWTKRGEGQPFFGLINFGTTHESQMFDKNVEKNRKSGRGSVTDPGQVTVPPYYPDTALVRKDIAQQYDNVHEMDRQVGEWLNRLEADGLMDNTIVIWTTDHGDGLPRAKREVYDSGIKVPMILHWPESLRPEAVEAGSVDQRLVSFIDFAPSVLTWAGVDVPGFMQGKATLADRDEKREFIYASKDRLDEMPFRERAVRDQRYKYLYNYIPGEPGATKLAYREQLDIMGELWAWYESDRMNEQQAFWFKPRPQEELYDLQADPHEVNNLAEDPGFTTELKRMRAAFADWQSSVEDWSNTPELEMMLEFWPDGKQPVTAEPDILVEDGRVTLVCDTDGASIGYRLDNGNWKVYSRPFIPHQGATISAKAVRYGWQESGVAEATVESGEWVGVDLHDPDLLFQGIPYVNRQSYSTSFSRFSPDLLVKGKKDLGFNPEKALSTTGGVITFQTDSPAARFRFRPGPGMNRGSEFAVFIDGMFKSKHVFNAKQKEMEFEVASKSAVGEATWEVTLPSWSNPELMSLEVKGGSGLLPMSETRRGVYVALGDSITHGTGQGSATHLTWPFLLSRKLDHSLYNLAVGGAGVSVAAGESLAALDRIDLITILIGYNDWNSEADSSDEFKRQYNQLLQAVRASHPDTPVFCISPLVTRREVSKSSGIKIDEFRSAVQQLVEEWQASDSNIHFINGEDVSSLANLRPEETGDMVHLGIEGAAILSESLFSAISAYSVTEDEGFIELDNGLDTRVVIAPEMGGELSSFRVRRNGEWHELLYRALDYSKQPGWRGKAPLLWPATGLTLFEDKQKKGYRVGGEYYPMPFHGFARNRVWRVVDQGATDDYSSVTLQLSADEETRKYYPFGFDMQVEYRLQKNRLSLVYRVTADAENDGAMPFSIGNHITYRAPLISGANATDLQFENDLPDRLLRSPDKTFSGTIEASPYRGLHGLGDLPRREAVSLSGLPGPAKLTVYDPSGLQLRMVHEASQEPVEPVIRFNLWADATEGFFSPEPWMGLQNSLNTGQGLVSVEPGQTWQWQIDIIPGWDLKESL